MLVCLTVLVGAGRAPAQTNLAPGSYVRSFVNDLPDQPLVSVAVTGLTNVACFTIEEILPGPATAQSVSGDGVWLPDLHAIRWGPFFNAVATNVNYRLTGMPASYPVSGGAWLDGQCYLVPGVTMVTVLPVGGDGLAPSPPPQVAMPVFAGVNVATNGSFENPSLGAGTYVTYSAMTPTQRSQLGWSGAGGVTLFTTNSALGYASVPDGRQGISLQSTGSISQTINFPAAGSYKLTWMAASRGGQLNPAIVQVDGVTVGNWQTTSTAWGAFSSTFNIAAPGNHAVMLAGLGNGGGDVSVGVDSVSLSAIWPADVTISCATPGALIYYTLDGSRPNTSTSFH